MFDFLTGIFDVFTGLFEAIQGLINGIVCIVQWVFSIGEYVVNYYDVVYSMIPVNLIIVFSPLLGLAVAAFILKFISWVKHMIPFN